MGTSPGDDVTPAAAVDVAIFRLRRLWAKPGLHRQLSARVAPGGSLQLSHILVVHAVHGVTREAGPGDEVTIGAVAERLDVDPSTASRLVSDAIDAGYVARHASELDARRARLELTDAGRTVMDVTARYRRSYIDKLMADWSREDRERFAQLLTRFTEAAAAAPPDPGKIGRALTDAAPPQTQH